MSVHAEYNTESNALAHLVQGRHSCRRFTGDHVAHETVEAILDVAAATPSWCNTQPWHVYVTEGAETDRFRDALLAEISTGMTERPDIAFPESYEGVYLDRRRESGWQLYESVGIERGDRRASAQQMMENFALFGAPHVAVVTTEAKLGTYGVVDCGLFVQTFLLASASHGVATIPQAAIASQAPFIGQYFDVPSDRRILLGISFGYAEKDHPINGYRTSRQSISDMVTWRTDS